MRCKEFFCARKHKFGLNMMATVDYQGRFLDVQISHPASTSDYLAFATSDLKTKLEQPGFLAPGLSLFGDNAYSNTHYMVTPFKGKVTEEQDSYNFFHSQLRIQVECV
jgi:DDE superfamily endonuclease